MDEIKMLGADARTMRLQQNELNRKAEITVCRLSY